LGCTSAIAPSRRPRSRSGFVRTAKGTSHLLLPERLLALPGRGGGAAGGGGAGGRRARRFALLRAPCRACSAARRATSTQEAGQAGGGRGGFPTGGGGAYPIRSKGQGAALRVVREARGIRKLASQGRMHGMPPRRACRPPFGGARAACGSHLHRLPLFHRPFSHPPLVGTAVP
jgi:hypothetical protein